MYVLAQIINSFPESWTLQSAALLRQDDGFVYGVEADINWTYEHGANSYLVKPVGFEALVEIVNAIHHYWLNVNERPSL